MTKLQELQNKLAAKKLEAKNLIDDDNATVDQIEAVKNEIGNLEAKIKMQEQFDNEANARQNQQMQNTGATPMSGTDPGAGIQDPNAAYEEAFYNALAGKGLTAEQGQLLAQNALSSESGEDGGYAIPVDQQTEIVRLKREFKSLRNLVSVESVKTKSGSRNIEVDAEHNSFGTIAENGTITDVDTPKIYNVAYSILTKGGILTIPNNLLNDAKALKAYINGWLAKKGVATENSMILNLLTTLSKTAITGIDDVKTILNKTLDPAISEGATIIMNQDSFDYFDQLKYPDGKPVLTEDVTDETKRKIKGRSVEVFSRKTLKNRVETVDTTTTTYSPVIIGHLKSAVTLFDRELISLLSTNIGGGAFETNTTKTRGLMRLDTQLMDTEAIIFGEVVTEVVTA